jgi:hypothetical protein
MNPIVVQLAPLSRRLRLSQQSITEYPQLVLPVTKFHTHTINMQNATLVFLSI